MKTYFQFFITHFALKNCFLAHTFAQCILLVLCLFERNVSRSKIVALFDTRTKFCQNSSSV